MSETAPVALGFTDRRVLGTIAEKALTLVGEGYPLTANSILTGCNQKSNRDPVTDFEDGEIEDSLERLMVAKLVEKLPLSSTGRTEKYKHKLYDAWQINKPELAILAELLLRGSQTEGELRTRASRMDEIADLETLRDHCKKLAGRKMVVYLTAEGKRGTALTHGYYEPDELADERKRFAGGGEPAPRSAGPSVQELISPLEAQIKELKMQVERLSAVVADLQRTRPAGAS